MVKVDRTPTPPPSLAVEKAKASGSYCCDDVVRQLTTDFKNKCYICELKPSDIEVEHLLPHQGGSNRNLMFDWNNLFLSCRHCNNIKNNIKYDGNIIDCTNDDPETHISFILNDNDVIIKALDKDIKSICTTEIIYDIFNKNSASLNKRIEALLDRSSAFATFKRCYIRSHINVYPKLEKYVND